MLGAPKVGQSLRSRHPESFTRLYRLSHRDGYNHVVRNKSIADKHFKVFYVPNENRSAKLGIMLSKKSLPRAIDRNYMKRRIREIFRKHGVKQCKLDIVVLPRAPLHQECQIYNLNALFNQVEKRCAE